MIKKLITLFLLLLSYNSFAQVNIPYVTDHNVTKVFTIGPEVAFPVSQFVKSTGVGYGFNGTFELGYKTWGFFVEAGFTHFPGNTIKYGNSTISSYYNNIPVVFGAKYYTKERVFFGFGYGVHFFSKVSENPTVVNNVAYINRSTNSYEKYGIALECGYEYPIEGMFSFDITGRYLYLDKTAGMIGFRAGLKLTLQ